MSGILRFWRFAGKAGRRYRYVGAGVFVITGMTSFWFVTEQLPSLGFATNVTYRAGCEIRVTPMLTDRPGAWEEALRVTMESDAFLAQVLAADSDIDAQATASEAALAARARQLLTDDYDAIQTLRKSLSVMSMDSTGRPPRGAYVVYVRHRQAARAAQLAARVGKQFTAWPRTGGQDLSRLSMLDSVQMVETFGPVALTDDPDLLLPLLTIPCSWLAGVATVLLCERRRQRRMRRRMG